MKLTIYLLIIYYKEILKEFHYKTIIFNNLLNRIKTWITLIIKIIIYKIISINNFKVIIFQQTLMKLIKYKLIIYKKVNITIHNVNFLMIKVIKNSELIFIFNIFYYSLLGFCLKRF